MWTWSRWPVFVQQWLHNFWRQFICVLAGFFDALRNKPYNNCILIGNLFIAYLIFFFFFFFYRKEGVQAICNTESKWRHGIQTFKIPNMLKLLESWFERHNYSNALQPLLTFYADETYKPFFHMLCNRGLWFLFELIIKHFCTFIHYQLL